MNRRPICYAAVASMGVMQHVRTVPCRLRHKLNRFSVGTIKMTATMIHHLKVNTPNSKRSSFVCFDMVAFLLKNTHSHTDNSSRGAGALEPPPAPANSRL